MTLKNYEYCETENESKVALNCVSCSKQVVVVFVGGSNAILVDCECGEQLYVREYNDFKTIRVESRDGDKVVWLGKLLDDGAEISFDIDLTKSKKLSEFF